MNVVVSNDNYSIYNSDVSIRKNIPSGCYDLAFIQDSGFVLKKRDVVSVNEKLYGNVDARVDKILKSFKLSDRNLGVILSGEKGSGKTVLAKRLAIKAAKCGLPTVFVSQNTSGLAEYISSIDQQMVVFFDEFEKMFNKRYSENACDQEDFLSVLDNPDSTKKIYVVAINEVHDLHECFINRPGRFHYHFRFGAPDWTNVEKYLIDNLNNRTPEIMRDMRILTSRGTLTYDCLRAVCFELNQGYSVAETVKDLNLVPRTVSEYAVELVMSDGSRYFGDSDKLDVCDGLDTMELQLFNERESRSIFLEVEKNNVCPSGDRLMVEGENVRIVGFSDFKLQSEGMCLDGEIKVRRRKSKNDDAEWRSSSSGESKAVRMKYCRDIRSGKIVPVGLYFSETHRGRSGEVDKDFFVRNIGIGHA